ncbi:MAG: TetR family transcriptional regulator [Myxococcota bacterium]
MHSTAQRQRRRKPMSRQDAKEHTRRALKRAALKLLSQSSFDALSLREVTREAGVSPTAFYRHFGDTEELGLELVEEAFGTMRAMLRVARSDPTMTSNAINRSVEIVTEHVAHHNDHMRFVLRERHGGMRRIRQAIRRELRLLTDELAIDLAAFEALTDWGAGDRRMLADLLVSSMVTATGELLDARGEVQREIAQRASKQLRLVVLGASLWTIPPPAKE